MKNYRATEASRYRNVDRHGNRKSQRGQRNQEEVPHVGMGAEPQQRYKVKKPVYLGQEPVYLGQEPEQPQQAQQVEHGRFASVVRSVMAGYKPEWQPTERPANTGMAEPDLQELSEPDRERVINPFLHHA